MSQIDWRLLTEILQTLTSCCLPIITFLAALLGLIGVIIGSNITSRIQNRLLEKQRIWQIEDKAREIERQKLGSRRSELISLREIVNQYFSLLDQRITSNNLHIDKEIAKIQGELKTQSFLLDPDAFELFSKIDAEYQRHKEIFDVARKTSNLERTKELEVGTLYHTLEKLQIYFKQQIEDTYK
jgi:xanthosine utilization system XapX-like protein